MEEYNKHSLFKGVMPLEESDEEESCHDCSDAEEDKEEEPFDFPGIGLEEMGLFNYN